MEEAINNTLEFPDDKRNSTSCFNKTTGLAIQNSTPTGRDRGNWASLMIPSPPRQFDDVFFPKGDMSHRFILHSFRGCIGDENPTLQFSSLRVFQNLKVMPYQLLYLASVLEINMKMMMKSFLGRYSVY